MPKFYHYFFMMSLLFVVACGQKGPLYIEDKPAAAEQEESIKKTK